MNDLANVNHEIRLEVSEDVVLVEIDGIRGEVRHGQAREVREALAHAAVQIIQRTTRSRRAEQQMLSRAGLGDIAGSADQRIWEGNA